MTSTAEVGLVNAETVFGTIIIGNYLFSLYGLCVDA